MSDLYKPICAECDEHGDYTLATQEVERLGVRYPACQRHYDAAGERGATMWSTEDVGITERCQSALVEKQRGALDGYDR